MPVNIPESQSPRVVILGAGFGGLRLARKLARSRYQVVLVDRNNYHQFQPLFYQVAMSGLEPSSIVFPIRKMFQKKRNVFIRVAEVQSIDRPNKRVITNLGFLNYDYLVVGMGANTNFFGNRDIERRTFGMKSVSEALVIRNEILADLEKALVTRDFEERQGLLDIAIVGGGPTGVELAGALAEMKKYIVPKDYPELDPTEIDIYLLQGSDRLLDGMSKHAGRAALKYLNQLGVKVYLNALVVSFDGRYIKTNSGLEMRCDKVFWAAGVRAVDLPGLPEIAKGPGNRLRVESDLRVVGTERIFAIGDIAYMEEGDYTKGHPQVAQVAIQMADHLGKSFKKIDPGNTGLTFRYVDKGSMATIGRNKAVADLPFGKTKGWFAWVLWLLVHVFQLIGVKNRLFVFINWFWNYFSYDQSLRLIIRPKNNPKEHS
jgi:NADH:ubiquinone reductase (H+-translocating)